MTNPFDKTTFANVLKANTIITNLKNLVIDPDHVDGVITKSKYQLNDDFGGAF